MLQAVRELRASVEESHSEWMKVKWRDIVNIVSLKVLSELHLEQVIFQWIYKCSKVFCRFHISYVIL